MKHIVDFFKKRWVISLLGLIAIALIIWFVGPLIAIAGREPLVSPLVRGLTILFAALVWLVVTLLRQLRMQRAGKEIAAGIVQAGSAEPDAGEAEVEVLRGRFEEAIALLRKSKSKGKGKGKGKSSAALNLYELPWYMIIGPPGAGKTTALLNSGLDFPLAERFGREALRGVGGTRDCDWWFTEQAVLLDTAGRYTTQDSHAQVDKTAWEGFLELLKKHRKRRPLNGLLVAISLQDLMLLNEQQIDEHANAIRKRIQELYEYFGIRFPVYVLFTKADLIAGFMEFFEDLGQEGRSQVWGATFPLTEAGEDFDVVRAFGEEYATLVSRLNDRLLARLATERDVQRRAAIYGFPRQVAGLRKLIESFLSTTLRDSRYEHAPLVRGVYFTSGTQEGTPIDRVMGSLARSFGLSQRALASYGGHGRSYFLSDLLNKVVFRESEIAGTNRRLEMRRAWLQRGAYLGTFAFTALVLLVWTVSFFNNRAYTAAVAEQTAAAQVAVDALLPAQSRPSDARPLLNTVRAIPGGYADQQSSVPWRLRFGLYQGDDLGRAAVGAYRRVLANSFLPRLTLRLEQQMRQGASNPEFLFQALKTYLMLEDADHFDPEMIKAWVLLDWERNLPRAVTTEQRQELVVHLDALLENMPEVLPVPLDAELVRQSRRVISRMSPAQQIYARMKAARIGADLPEFRITDAAGADASQVFVRASGEPLNTGVPGLYTYDGYWNVFTEQTDAQVEALAADGWVLGQEQGLLGGILGGGEYEALKDEVTGLYLEDFVQRWQALVLDIELAPFVSPRQAAYMLEILSAPDSPLKKLLVAVKKETSLDRPPEGLGSLIEQAGEKAAALQNTIPGSVGRPALPPVATRGLYVAGRFKELHRLVPDEGEGGRSPIDVLLTRLNEMYVYLENVATEIERGGDPLSVSGGETVTTLSRDAKRLPQPLNGMMTELADNTAALTSGRAIDHLNAKWAEGPLEFCRRAISRRYPLDGGSEVDIAVADFTRFFKPGGEIDKFFTGYLAKNVDTTSDPWRWLAAAGEDAPTVSAQALEQFRRASIIRDAFFQFGDAGPTVTFDLTPITMDTSIDTFTMDLEGQQVTYDHGPIAPTALSWPGPKPRQVMIRIAPQSGMSVAEERGPWAWFRILEQSNPQATSRPEVFDIQFDVGGRKASYQLRAGSAFNPFDLAELQLFRCPERL